MSRFVRAPLERVDLMMNASRIDQRLDLSYCRSQLTRLASAVRCRGPRSCEQSSNAYSFTRFTAPKRKTRLLSAFHMQMTDLCGFSFKHALGLDPRCAGSCMHVREESLSIVLDGWRPDGLKGARTLRARRITHLRSCALCCCAPENTPISSIERLLSEKTGS